MQMRWCCRRTLPATPTCVPPLAHIEAAWGGIDLMVYLAGTYAPMRAPGIDLARVRQTFDINVIGCYAALAAVMPGMLAQGAGAVAIVSSVAGYRGLPNALSYGPTKAALINLAEALYLDLRPRDKRASNRPRVRGHTAHRAEQVQHARRS